MNGDAHPTRRALRERRERVVARLTDSFARDEIGLEAFERRIDTAYRSQSDAELDALVADLTSHASSEAVAVTLAQAEAVPAEAAAPSPTGVIARIEPVPVLRALFSNIERSDRITLPATSKLEAIFGNLELDLRDARFGPGVTELHVRAVFGSIEISVPADVAVEVRGAAVFGNFEGTTRTTADPDAPTLRVVGSATFASVAVRTVPPLRVQKLAAELRGRRQLPP